MEMKDKGTSIQYIKDLAKKFITERNWEKFHTDSNIAKSICLEAAELLEHYQWDDPRPKHVGEHNDEAVKELADIIIYSLHFANNNNIDIATVVEKKLKEVELRHPIK